MIKSSFTRSAFESVTLRKEKTQNMCFLNLIKSSAAVLICLRLGFQEADRSGGMNKGEKVSPALILPAPTRGEGPADLLHMSQAWHRSSVRGVISISESFSS